MRKLVVGAALALLALSCSNEDKPAFDTSSLAPVRGTITPGAEVLGATEAPADAADQQFLDLINQARATPLAWSNDLASYAEAHLANMVAQGALVHSDLANSNLLNRWSVVGENIGYGSDVGVIFNAYMNSPGHKANILSSEFSHLGSASVTDAGGIVWTVQAFGG